MWPFIVESELQEVEKMPEKKQDAAKIRAWKKAKIDRIIFEARKEMRLPERIAAAVEAGRAGSRQEYIIGAICERLERDGITGDDRQEE